MATIQFHILTDRGPNVINRDDAGAPKVVTIGGKLCQRISSQCAKNALRNSLMRETELANLFGVRTRWVGRIIFEHLRDVNGVDETKATAIAQDIAEHYGAMKSETPLKSTTLTFLSPAELQAAKRIAEEIVSGKRKPPSKLAKDDKKAKGKKDENKFSPWIPVDDLLLKTGSALDIALGGRMLSNHKQHQVTGALRSSHAFTTHALRLEDDYFAGQDTVTQESETETGAGHLDVQRFGAGVFYAYHCLDTDLLLTNLDGKRELAMFAAVTLAQDVLTITPSAKGGSFAADAYASYALVEAGYGVARTLGGAFTAPVPGPDYVGGSIEALQRYRANQEAAYRGLPAELSCELIATPTETLGSLEGVLRTCVAAFDLQRPSTASLASRIVAEALAAAPVQS